MTRNLIRSLLCLSLYAGVAAGAGARDIYVSPQGNDAASGAQAQPWQTLAKVNAEAAAGDTFHFLPGEYEGTLAPAGSGEPGKPIVFRTAERHQATLYAAPLSVMWARSRSVMTMLLSGAA